MSLLIALALAVVVPAVRAKLPPLNDAAKAKAAETTARAAWQAKVDAFQLCKAQDRTVAYYRGSGGAGKPAGTPGTGAECSDPGAFAYNPPEQKPLEASGAHSPTGTAASPPSVSAPSQQMAPAKK